MQTLTKCPKCRTALPDKANFCHNCGLSLGTTGLQSISNTILHPERKRVTALFSDLSEYSSLTEKIDPEIVKQITSTIFDGIRQVVKKYEGSIERFAGDGVLIIFGVPQTHEDDPIRAIQAARDIHARVESLSPRYNKLVGRRLSMHSGVNTGIAVTADMNPEKGTSGATGDAINLAARLSDLAAAGEILVGPETHKVCRGHFSFQPLKPTKLKGKSEPIPIFKLKTPKADATYAFYKREVSSAMLGRDQELARLESLILRAINGRGSVVNVFGEAGIGKSRLLAELRKQEVIKSVLLLEGRSISIGTSLSFHPVIDLFKQWSGIMEDDPPDHATDKLEATVRNVCGGKADEVFPFIATMMGMRLSSGYARMMKDIEGDALEKLILKNVRELLTMATILNPIVIVMEDLHWADTSSLDLLKSLFPITRNHRIVFINVFRPGYWQKANRGLETLPRWLPEIDFSEIAIRPLDRQMGEALVSSVLRVRGRGHAIKHQIVDRADGNPLFLEEIVRSLIDEGAIVRTNSIFEATEKMYHFQIPATVNNVLMTRIDRLEDETRDLIKVASVIGRSFFARILKEVVTSVDQIDERLEYLKDAQFIRERIRLGELEYVFKHALVQEAAYESTLMQQRKRLHREVAQSIEKIFKERLQEFYGMLAFHYSKAEETEKAEKYMMRAGSEALRSSASNEALDYFQKALQLYLGKFGDKADPAKLALLEKNIGLAFFYKAQWPEAVKYFDKVLERWGMPVPKTGPGMLLKLSWKLLVIIKAVYWRLPKSGKIPGNQEIDAFELYYKVGQSLPYVDHTRIFILVLDLFRRTLRYNLYKIPKLSIYWLGVSAIFTTSALSFRLSNRLLEMSKRYSAGKDIRSRMNYACLSTMIYHCQGTWEKITEPDEELLTAALRTGDFWHVYSYLWFYGLIKGEQGDFGQLKRTADKLYDIGENYHYHQAILSALFLKIDFFIRKRNTYDALPEVERAVSYAQNKGVDIDQIMLLSLKAEIQQRTEDVAGAHHTILQASEFCEMRAIAVMPVFIAPYLSTRFFIDVEKLQSAISSGNQSAVNALQKKAYFSGKAAVRNSRKYAPYRPKILRHMGRYYWLSGQQSKAVKWWNKAIKEGKRLNARPELARTYLEIGKRLLESGAKHRKVNEIGIEGYLKKANMMFRDMNLQQDQYELDKVTPLNTLNGEVKLIDPAA